MSGVGVGTVGLGKGVRQLCGGVKQSVKYHLPPPACRPGRPRASNSASAAAYRSGWGGRVVQVELNSRVKAYHQRFELCARQGSDLLLQIRF